MAKRQFQGVWRESGRAVAIAGLAALAVGGGIIGATVTAESTISGNKITIDEKANASIIVTGEPVNVSFEEGVLPDQIHGFVGVREFTVTNLGEVDATVQLLAVPDFEIPNSITNSAEKVLFQLWKGVMDETGAFPEGLLMNQSVAVGPGEVTSHSTQPFTVGGGESVKVTALFDAFDGTGFDKLHSYSKLFDLEFFYVNS